MKNPNENEECNSQKFPDIWVSYKEDLLVHKEFFEKGILLVKANTVESEDEKTRLRQKAIVSDTSFKALNRHLGLFNGSRGNGGKNFSYKPPSPKGAKKLLDNLRAGSNGDFKISSEVAFFNRMRREEVFLPLFFNDGKSVVGFYVYPWLCKSGSEFQFKGFGQFVTSACMFGSNLQGTDQIGRTYPLIKHDIEFYNEEYITSIVYSKKGLNPYEELVFDEFKKLASLADKLANKESRQLLLHLPYYDYVLFGVELYIRGRMTLSALNLFFKIIFEKKEELLQKIIGIFKPFNFEIQITSPFENLFGPTKKLMEQLESEDGYAKKILNMLEIPVKNLQKHARETEKENERKLVQFCLSKLETNEFNMVHCQVWKDFLSIKEREKINTLEGLFKVANAVIIGVASKGTKNYETCSILPLSEKQIQVSYDNIYKDYSKKKNTYSPVVNLTFLDPVISYTPNDFNGSDSDRNDLEENDSKVNSPKGRDFKEIGPNGNVFYFSFSHKNLTKLLQKSLGPLSENIGLFAQQKSTFSLEKILSDVNDSTGIFDRTVTLDQKN